MFKKILKFWQRTAYWKKALFIYFSLLLIQYFIFLSGGIISFGVYDCGDFGGRTCSFSTLLQIPLIVFLLLFAAIVQFLIIEANFRLPIGADFYLILNYLILLSAPFAIAYGFRRKKRNIAAAIALSPLAALLIYYVYRFLF